MTLWCCNGHDVREDASKNGLYFATKGETKLVYICDNCRFLFERQGEVLQCPDCGSGHIRPAVDTEVAEYNNRRQSEEQ